MRNKWTVRCAIVISLAAEVALLYQLPSVLLGWMYLTGRSDCSFRETVQSVRFEDRYYTSRAKMMRLSHLKRQEDGMDLWWTPNGEFWVPKGGGTLRFGVLAEQELAVYGSGVWGVRPGDVVLDCGSDVGMFTRPALEMGAKLVVAIDPASVVQPCLKRNFQREIAEGRVIVYPKGVWNRTQSLPLHGNSVVLQYGPPTEVIPLTTIDDLLEELHLDRVDFIKMDIEGAEKEAVEGARRTLLRFKPRMALSCEHFQADARAIPKAVQAIRPGYVINCGPCVRWGDRFYPFVLYFE